MRLWIAASLALAACSHSATTAYLTEPSGPSSSGTDVQLTFNPLPDYAPDWSADGASILYDYSPSGEAHDNRCLGLLPAAGGTRLWSFCDDGTTQADSASSFGGVALAADGALLYLEATSHLQVFGTRPVPGFDHVTLYLADTAQPLRRQALASFPMFVGGHRIDWLERLSWSDAATFTALADTMIVRINEGSVDTLRFPFAVVRGTIATNGATLQLVDGTLGATIYSPAGPQLAFSTGGLDIFGVPPTGGTPVKLATVPPDTGQTLLDFSCQAAQCIALTRQFRALGVNPQVVATEGLMAFELSSGAFHPIEYRGDIKFVSPRLAPNGTDVVIEVNPVDPDLHLYRGFVP